MPISPTILFRLQKNQVVEHVDKENVSPNYEEKTPITPMKKQTITVFDWDDTLHPQSFLVANNYTLQMQGPITCVQTLAQFKQLEISIIKILCRALDAGKVFIITNSETGWVEMSAAKFMPNIIGLLSKVEIVSARSTMSPMYPDDPWAWKYYTFLSCLIPILECATKTQRNILSFGDSFIEREVTRDIAQDLPNTLTKTVKFVNKPTLFQLRFQLDKLEQSYDYINKHDKSLDLRLLIKKLDSTTEVATQPPQTPAAPVRSKAQSPLSSPLPSPVFVLPSIIEDVYDPEEDVPC